jgi:hypothetical protein
MKIIQSFYQIGNETAFHQKSNDNYLLNFYSALLSFILLKKHFGKVIMYCNRLAYDEMLKFIPYDEFIIEEFDYLNSDNYKTEWGLLKFNIYNKQTEPFIHIDTDVFLFDNLFKPFITDKQYDGIVQSVEDHCHFITSNDNLSVLFFDTITQEMINNQIHSFNCGVVGFRDMSFCKIYYQQALLINQLFNENVLKAPDSMKVLIFEQLCLYQTVKKYSKNFYKVINDDDYLNNRISGYTHLLGGNKYVGFIIIKIRDKIIDEYPDYIDCIYLFEKKIRNRNIKILNHKRLI